MRRSCSATASGLLACSSPTGPAFEGAQISCGQRAAPGAIERVRIDPETLEPRFKVIGSDLWSDDPGFAAATAKTGVTGVCGSGIIEVIAEMYLAGVINQDGVIDGRLAARSDRVVAERPHVLLRVASGRRSPMQITQNDVRAIQLAKAALYAGVRLLMDELGVERVDRIRLAGAFGSHIDLKYAMVLGMIPDCDLANVGSAGNAAGTGRAHRAARFDGAHDYRGSRATRGEDRDGDRATIPGALRRGDGDPAQECTVSRAHQGGNASGSQGIRGSDRDARTEGATGRGRELVRLKVPNSYRRGFTPRPISCRPIGLGLEA